MSSCPDPLYFEPHAHSLRCRSCSGTLLRLQTMKCCKRSVSLCENCFTDRMCPDCIRNSPTTGCVIDLKTAFVKISKIDEYSPGDIVLFHPVLERVDELQTHLNLLHIDKPKPFVLLHEESYKAFGLEQGKFCDLVIARLTSNIKRNDLQVSRKMSIAFGESNDEEETGFFCTVKAEPVDTKFPSSKS